MHYTTSRLLPTLLSIGGLALKDCDQQLVDKSAFRVGKNLYIYHPTEGW
jgi:hypothetical protein